MAEICRILLIGLWPLLGLQIQGSLHILSSYIRQNNFRGD
ncbi:hypothetical protein LINPERPRIM_LOCUS7425 [Linum perenne]